MTASSPASRWADAADAITGLASASTRLHPDDIPAVVAAHAALVGLADLTIYLVDLEQRVLLPFLGPDAKPTEPLAIDGTVAGRAYRTEQAVVTPAGEGGGGGRTATIWLPLLDSAERLGVISARPLVAVDEDLLAFGHALANLAGELVASKAVYGDVVTRTRRTRGTTIAAELRWAMLPPLTFTGRGLTISGVVEPAYEIAGDTFDYAVNGDRVDLAIVDAMGHGLEAALIANLAVIAYRHSRRRGGGPKDAYRAMDEAVREQFGPEKFATAVLATLTVPTGQFTWINAGHPPPFVMRDGHRHDLTSEVCLPIGLGDADPEIAEAWLEPGDLALLFTDGVVEARAVGGAEFGRDRLGDLLVRTVAARQTLAETMRLLAHAVIDHQVGALQDDATMLMLAWDGPPAAERALTRPTGS